MTTETILIVLGALLTLIGILGGGFELKEAKFPRVGMVPRVLALLLGVALIGSQLIPFGAEETSIPRGGTTEEGASQPEESKSGAGTGASQPEESKGDSRPGDSQVAGRGDGDQPAAESKAKEVASEHGVTDSWYDAVFHLEPYQKTYCFNGPRYARCGLGQRFMDSGYPADLPGGWSGLPESWNSGIDAALCLSSNSKSYFFKGGEYIRLTDRKVDPGYPTALPGGWVGLPKSWNSGIDAALYFDPNSKSYFFKGNEYVRLTDTKVDPGYPKPLPGGWRNLPTSWHKGIDAAVFRNGHAYFFRRAEYVRLTGTTVDGGYPKRIAGNWPEG
jgi:hypothetical protein